MNPEPFLHALQAHGTSLGREVKRICGFVILSAIVKLFFLRKHLKDIKNIISLYSFADALIK